MGIFSKLLGALKGGAFAAPPAMRSVTLLQPESEIEARTDVEQLSVYIEELQLIVLTSWPAEVQGAVLAAAVRPGREARVWIETLPESLEHDATLSQSLSDVEGPVVTDVVSFAMYFSRGSIELPQLPRAWRDVAAASTQALQLPDGVLRELWPE